VQAGPAAQCPSKIPENVTALPQKNLDAMSPSVSCSLGSRDSAAHSDSDNDSKCESDAALFDNSQKGDAELGAANFVSECLKTECRGIRKWKGIQKFFNDAVYTPPFIAALDGAPHAIHAVRIICARLKRWRCIGTCSMTMTRRHCSVLSLAAAAAVCVTLRRSWRSEATRSVGRVVSAAATRHHEDDGEHARSACVDGGVGAPTQGALRDCWSVDARTARVLAFALALMAARRIAMHLPLIPSSDR
jgi:hypothetical protein